MKTKPFRVCVCGSNKFLTNIRLEIHNVPLDLHSDGTMSYDDTKGDSQGWDIDNQPEISCKECGHLYNLERDDDFNWFLIDAQPPQPDETTEDPNEIDH